MKNFKLVLILLLSSLSIYSQEFIDDSNFEEKINQRHAFGDDEFNIVIIEFYVEFNKQITNVGSVLLMYFKELILNENLPNWLIHLTYLLLQYL